MLFPSFTLYSPPI